MNRQNREIKRQYQLTPRRMGVWQIRNLADEKILVGVSPNLDQAFNRHRTQLKFGSHPNKRLQADWKALGSDAFAFEELDELSPSSEPGRDYREELSQLEDLWLDRLQPYGERGYNEPKKTQEERLRMIAENRRKARDAEESWDEEEDE